MRVEAHPVFLGTSSSVLRLAAEARQVLSSDSPIFIHGETGTGKGVLARWIHQNGPRASRPFVDLNCATLGRELLESELFGHERGAFTNAFDSKPGLLDVAGAGSAFLDEVGDLDLSVQPKLLKVLEERRYRRVGDVADRLVHARFITATHQDLEQLAEEGRFRRDLYYRICILPLHVPPLSERVEDIPVLARYFVERRCAEIAREGCTISDQAVTLLQERAWPGNIRELRSAIERAILGMEGTVLEPSHFAFLARRRPDSRASSSSRGPRSMTLTEAEKSHIKEVLHDAEGRVELAAIRLGISRSALYNKIKKHGLGEER